MIKVEYCKNVDLVEWYWSNLYPKISKAISNLKDSEWKDRISNQNVVRDILFEPISFLIRKYPWVQDYYNDHLTNAVPSNSDLVFEQCFKYKFITNIKGELVKRMGVKVCPYCNQQYVYSLKNENKRLKYLGDLDHFFPKSRFKLFSLSLWNLIISCKSCNQVFKGDGDWSVMLSPAEDGFGDDCVFHIEYGNVESMLGVSDDFNVYWMVRRNGVNEKKVHKIENNIRVFQLNELYSANKSEVQRILKLKALLSNGCYIGSFSALDISSSHNPLAHIFGDCLSEKNYVRIYHSKMIHDILFFN